MVDADLASAVQHYRSVIGASVQNRPIGPIESCAQDDQRKPSACRSRAVALRFRSESRCGACCAREPCDSPGENLLLCGWGQQPKERATPGVSISNTR